MTEKYWNSEIETMSRSDLNALQGERLAKQVAYIYANSGFWHDTLKAKGITPADIRGLSDLRKLPVTSKDDLRARRKDTGDPFSDTLCVKVTDLVRINHSTGTSGLPNIYGLTRNDFEKAGDAFARALYRTGMRPGDSTNSWLESAMSWHGFCLSAEGARRLGAAVYGCEPDNRSIAPTVFELLAGADLSSVFVYHPELEIGYLRKNNIDPKSVHPNLRYIYSAALTTDTRRSIWERAWGVPYVNMAGSGDQYLVWSECEYSKPYLHGLDDRLIIEVLNPETLEPVEPGERGELVVTNLWAEATPYVRYRMEDIVIANTERCQCGSTHTRLKFLGRMAWSCNVEGKRVFSDDVEDVLWRFPEAEFAQYQIVRYEEQPQSRLSVRCTRHDTGRNDAQLADEIVDALQREIGVPSEVAFVSDGEIGLGTVKFERVLKRPGRG
ncbi:MAG TPA: hypothetical protein VFQ88_11995 [Nevskiaceae bacterium]|nr:hypothetical protein [Nevskiaceae bacterium]